MIKCICKICNKEFYETSNRIKSGRGKYCSHKCRLIGLHNSIKGKNHPRWVEKIKRKCLYCNKIFFTHQHRIKDNRGKLCSLKCKYLFGHTEETKKIFSRIFKGKSAWNKGKKCPQISENMKGSKNHQWKGGIKIHRRYILIYKPKHPYSIQGYIKEHRFVMEQYLGRYLTREEVVHHKNKNTLDNRIENLKLFPNSSKHTKFHNKLRRLFSPIVSTSSFSSSTYKLTRQSV